MRRNRVRGSAAVLSLLMAALLWGTLAPSASAAQPAPTPTPAVATGATEYVVQKGDTLYSIAKKHGVSVDQLVAWNDITNPNQIKVGQKLVVHESGASASAKGSSKDVSVSVKSESFSWSTSVRTIVIFGGILLLLLVLLTLSDRVRK